MRGQYAKNIIILSALAGGLGLFTWRQNRIYHAHEYAFLSGSDSTNALNPRHVLVHAKLGTILDGEGKVEQAIVEYRKALELDPEYAIAHVNLGRDLAGQGRLKEAIAEFRHALKDNPGLAGAHNNLGWALASLGETAEAIAEFRQALKLEPDYAVAHKNLGEALAREGQAAKDIRDGIALLDAAGEATIKLPGYFQALYGDFRYLLTPIGPPAPGLFVKKEIADSRFTISGGTPGRRVRWQVAGIRRQAKAGRVPAGTDEGARKRGYQHPEPVRPDPE